MEYSGNGHEEPSWDDGNAYNHARMGASVQIHEPVSLNVSFYCAYTMPF